MAQWGDQWRGAKPAGTAGGGPGGGAPPGGAPGRGPPAPARRQAGGAPPAPPLPPGAAAMGAAMPRAGGNAVDAALATAFARGVAEPWMSGIGGGGVMVVFDPRTRRVHVIDYTMTASAGLDPARYPLSGGTDDGL